MSYEPGNYVKGDQVRVAHTPSEAVALEFRGFTRAEDASEVPYRELQAQAKRLGIPANQSEDELRRAIADAPPVDQQ